MHVTCFSLLAYATRTLLLVCLALCVLYLSDFGHGHPSYMSIAGLYS